MSGLRIVAGFALRESVRRRVFIVVAVLSVGYLALYALGAWQASKSINGPGATGVAGIDATIVGGATLLGLAMFGTVFLGTVLAVFLTLGAVRGDAERGLLQPVIVRPLSRATLLAGRFAAAASVCAAYVVVMFLAEAAITGAFVGWWPDRVIVPALSLGLAVAILAGMSLAGSVFLASTANGIAVFMVFGAGLVAGLLGQIAQALGSHTLGQVATVSSWALPFEALYQVSLSEITADTIGLSRLAIDLGPFGGAASFGPLLWPWALLYLGVVGAVALRGFARRDL